MGIFIFAVFLVAQSWAYRRLISIQYLIMFMACFCFVSFFTLNVYTANALEAKILFSRFRYIGFAFLAPSGLLFFSSILKRWNWLHNNWVRALLFIPGVGTTLITLGVFDPNLHVYNHAPFEYLGVSVLTFQNGPWFMVHYRLNNIVTVLAITLLIQAMIVDRQRRKQIFFLSVGVISGVFVDAYCVATNSPLRWLMVSAGTFAITELGILYAAKKYDLLGILSAEKMEQAKLQKNMETQTKMLALIAHDLSGNIRQQAQITQILRKRLQDNHSEMLNTLDDSAQASGDLIHNIMKWIKSQDEEFKPKIESVEVHKLLKGCIDTVQAAFGDRNVTVNVETPADPYFIKCDLEMMASIIRNLLSNSVRASTDDKPILVKITEHGARVRIAIHDEGRGMAPEQVRSLFTDQGIKSGGSGYGLGLVLVRHFVELHQGQLEIESIPLKGTQSFFSIPL